MGADLPIVCRLTDAELQERRQTVLRQLGCAVEETQELPGGYACRFASDDAFPDESGSLIRLERRCCPFLTSRLTAEPNDGPFGWKSRGRRRRRGFWSRCGIDQAQEP